jgi:two-component system chemotaxis response regulator CheY
MRSRRLMVVDDSLVFRNRIQRLATGGALPDVAVVASAGDGVEALRQAREHRPDFVTMDPTMPLMDGPACLAALRELLPDSRVLVVSALSDRSTALKAMMNGAHGFLLKPFSDRQLIDSLQELMQ